MKGKLRDLQKLLRYLIEIVNSTSKDGTSSFGGWSACSGFPDCHGLSGLSPTIFVLYLNDLPCETITLTSPSSIVYL